MAKPKLEVVATTEAPVKTNEYFRLVRNEQNMFSVESIVVAGDMIIDKQSTESTFLPIAFDKLRRKTGEAFFKAVQDNL